MVDKLTIVLDDFWPEAGANKLLGQHWSRYYKVKDYCKAKLLVGFVKARGGIMRPCCFKSPVTLQIERHYSARGQEMDEENCGLATKPLVDLLRRLKMSWRGSKIVTQGGLGLIYDDDRANLIRLPIIQRPSDDGKTRTLITLTGELHDDARSWNDLEPAHPGPRPTARPRRKRRV